MAKKIGDVGSFLVNYYCRIRRHTGQFLTVHFFSYQIHNTLTKVVYNF